MKTLMIAILVALVATASAQEFRAPIGPQKPVRAMETPPPVYERPKIEGALPKAFGPGRPATETGWRTHRSIPITLGNGTALSSSRSSFDLTVRLTRGARIRVRRGTVVLFPR